MKAIQQNQSVIIEGLSDFNVEHIFECGQAFRFNKMDDRSYAGVAFGKYLRITQLKDKVELWPCSLAEFESVWKTYFDLDTNYGEIKAHIASHYDILREATEFGYGIRILKQDPWEVIISFIISANNNIPRIKRALELISQKYGDVITDPEGHKHHAFPTAQQLMHADIHELRACGVGYRDKYILKTAQMVCQGEVDFNALLDMPFLSAEKELMRLSGVGKKVADCILLFGFEKLDAFPVDTWVKKVISEYFLTEDATLGQVVDFVESQFTTYAGYIQQYLFYYIREK